MVLSFQGCQQIQEIGRAYLPEHSAFSYGGFTLSPPKIHRKKNTDNEDLIVPMLKDNMLF